MRLVIITVGFKDALRQGSEGQIYGIRIGSDRLPRERGAKAQFA